MLLEFVAQQGCQTRNICEKCLAFGMLYESFLVWPHLQEIFHTEISKKLRDEPLTNYLGEELSTIMKKVLKKTVKILSSNKTLR